MVAGRVGAVAARTGAEPAGRWEQDRRRPYPRVARHARQSHAAAVAARPGERRLGATRPGRTIQAPLALRWSA